MMMTVLLFLATPADRDIVIDDAGVLTWENSRSEVALFGVNYYAPFVFEYSELTQRGIDIHDVIDRDLDQLARLGFDLVRIHCFDREFSDAEGGLIQNDHLELLDYQIAESKKRGIYTLLTPIAWWPTPNDMGGFSSHVPMADMVTDPAAWKLQARFLREFLEHVNPHTGMAYKEDPAIVALETINEPIPPAGTPDSVIVEYINSQVAAIRSTGCTKPVFFNGWGGRLKAVVDSSADGSSHGWYPTGLVSGSGIESDCLGMVDRHPTAGDPVLDGTPKMVYEFDAADTVNGVLYPAMARTFRSHGIQLATQFQYDVTECASHNAHWQTHYLNLIYTPQRALAMMIAAEAFRRLPRGGEYGSHPESDRFDCFHVDHPTGVAEMLSNEKFLYSASTNSRPPEHSSLTLVAGAGSSSVVEYEGTGAYFLEKVDARSWRLELYPDSVWIEDPFATGSVGREAARFCFREREMAVRLPGLAEDFECISLTNPQRNTRAEQSSFTAYPGVWTLCASGASDVREVSTSFACPAPDGEAVVAQLALPELFSEELDGYVRATVAGPEDAHSVTLVVGADEQAIPMTGVSPYEFECMIPNAWIRDDQLELSLRATFGQDTRLFPEGRSESEPTTVDPSELLRLGQRSEGDLSVSLSPGERVTLTTDDQPSLRFFAERFGADRQWMQAKLPVNLSTADFDLHNGLLVRARRTHERTGAFEVGLMMENGGGYGTRIRLSTDWADVLVPLASLRPLGGRPMAPFDLTRVMAVNLGMGPYTVGATGDASHGFEVQSVALVRQRPAWRAPCHAAGEPVVLYSGGTPLRSRFSGQAKYRAFECTTTDLGGTGYRIEADEFPEGSCVGIAMGVLPITKELGVSIAHYTTLVLHARAGGKNTTAFEIVLSEDNGTPFGATTECGAEWREIRIPLSSLRHFSHWDTGSSRAEEDDLRLHPDHVAKVHLTIGAWLYGEHAEELHAIEFSYIALERE